ncbi:hypothetical protein [Cryptosporangium aurantiacum]|uniref:hypothetical protein n=1 Tax=Cryptosporangium aurantiacum TaxID=134849 RepID=UPI000934A1BE|nr:hypothetical protein [Cryptosporangium aurantiacum]
MTDPREQLEAATTHYRHTESEHQTARQALIDAVITALKADITPTEVERLSPFTSAYIRRLAREHDVPPAAPGPKRAR